MELGGALRTLLVVVDEAPLVVRVHAEEVHRRQLQRRRASVALGALEGLRATVARAIREKERCNASGTLVETTVTYATHMRTQHVNYNRARVALRALEGLSTTRARTNKEKDRWCACQWYFD